MTGFFWIQFWHLEGAPREQVGVLSHAGIQLISHQDEEVGTNLDSFIGIISEEDNLEIPIRNGT